MQKKYSNIMQKWLKEPDYYKETLKQYYKQFNIDISKPTTIEVRLNSDFDFGARRRIENFNFSSLDKKFICMDEEYKKYAMQFEGIRFDSGPLADKVFFFRSSK